MISSVWVILAWTLKTGGRQYINTISRKTLIVIFRYHFEVWTMGYWSSFSNFQFCIGRPLPPAPGAAGPIHPKVKGIHTRTPRERLAGSHAHLHSVPTQLEWKSTDSARHHARGNTQIKHTLRRRWQQGQGKNEIISDIGARGLANALHVLFLSVFFFIKENWICAMTTQHAEPINILLTRKLPFDSDTELGSHPLMIPFHCL